MTNKVFTDIFLVRVPPAFRQGPSQLGREDQLLIEPTTGLGLDIDQRLARRNLVMI